MLKAACRNFGFFIYIHVIDALYYSVVNVLPDWNTPKGISTPGQGGVNHAAHPCPIVELLVIGF